MLVWTETVSMRRGCAVRGVSGKGQSTGPTIVGAALQCHWMWRDLAGDGLSLDGLVGRLVWIRGAARGCEHQLTETFLPRAQFWAGAGIELDRDLPVAGPSIGWGGGEAGLTGREWHETGLACRWPWLGHGS